MIVRQKKGSRNKEKFEKIFLKLKMCSAHAGMMYTQNGMMKII